jgi:hypothetical protein
MSVAINGELVLSDAAGTGVTKLPALGNVGRSIYPALDNHYFSLGNGQIVSASDRHPPVMASTKVQLFTDDLEGVSISPFADHDRELLALKLPSLFGTETAFKPVLFSLATGRSVSLGIGHQVAGDPQAAGVFASVAGRVVATTAVSHVVPDSRVELRDAGQPVVVLATAAELDHDLHQSRHLPVALTSYPSPSGNEVAVTVQPEYGSSTSGVVILNRAGKVLGTIATSAGPVGTGSVAWSPSGTSLAFPAAGRTSPSLTIATMTGQLQRQPFPASTAAEYRYCLWSPDGQSIICASGGVGQQWVIATMAAHVMTPVHGPGAPVAWLP